VRLVEFACNRPDRFDTRWRGSTTARRRARWVPQAIEEMGRAVVRRDGAGWSLACQRELEGSIYLAALTLDLWPKASAYGCPVKLIGADPDLKGNVPTGLANQALARENGYVYESIPQTGHLLQVERPEECRKRLPPRELGIA
jgi:pimeloyl-ACP methyl ester carboxylesterase